MESVYRIEITVDVEADDIHKAEAWAWDLLDDVDEAAVVNVKTVAVYQ